MSNLVSRHKNVIYYSIAIVAVFIGLFLWVNLGDDTNTTVNETAPTVNAIKQAVEDLQADHDGQDALAVCLGKLIIASQDRNVSDVEFETCVITTAVPARQTSEGTTPGGQTTVPEQSSGNLSSGSSSSSNSIPNNPPQQPENSPSVPPEPDNEGIILDLPILPKIHIPSPL